MFDPNKMNSFLGKTQCVWLYMIPCDDSMMTFFQNFEPFSKSSPPGGTLAVVEHTVQASYPCPSSTGNGAEAGNMRINYWHWSSIFLLNFTFGWYNHIIYVVTYIHTNGIIRIWSTSTMGSRLDVAQVCLVAAWPTWRFQNDVRSTKSASVVTFQGFKSCLFSCLNSWIKLFLHDIWQL